MFSETTMPSNNSSSTEIFFTEWVIIQASYLILVILVAIVGNSLIIFGILKKRLLDDVTNYFVLNLCISDILNASLKITTSVAVLFDSSWYPSKVICYFTTPFGVLFGAASVLSLTSVAVTRYLVIVSPLTYASKITPSVARIVVGGVWLASIVLSFPPVTWRSANIICQSGAISETYYVVEIVYVALLWLCVIVLPSMVMMWSYVRIYNVTCKHIRDISLWQPVASNEDNSNVKRAELRAAMVLALIGGVFILCWLPFFIILTMHKLSSESIDRNLFRIFLCWMFTNSAINPILLIKFNVEIRQAVRRSLSKFF